MNNKQTTLLLIINLVIVLFSVYIGYTYISIILGDYNINIFFIIIASILIAGGFYLMIMMAIYLIFVVFDMFIELVQNIKKYKK